MALEALTFHQGSSSATKPTFWRKYVGIFHFQVHLLPEDLGGLQKSSVMLCVTPLDNFHRVSFGQEQVARGYLDLKDHRSEPV